MIDSNMRVIPQENFQGFFIKPQTPEIKPYQVGPFWFNELNFWHSILNEFPHELEVAGYILHYGFGAMGRSENMQQ